MSSFTQIYRLSNCVIGGCKSVFQGRTQLSSPLVCNYTKKSAEQILGIEKPKRPLTPFFKFMVQMKPALMAKKPGISAKEAIVWSSKHWQQLDAETKAKMSKEYEKDREDYKKIKALYEASLTEEQKEKIALLKMEMADAKEKKKLKADSKELGKPKKPPTSYFLFMITKRDQLKGKSLKECQDITRNQWASLPKPEKEKYEKQAHELYAKFRKDLQAWEIKMISLGREDLVRVKTSVTRKPRAKKNTE